MGESKGIWLIGDTNSFLSETKLPTVSGVLKVFYNHHVISRKTIKDSEQLVAKEVENIWKKTAIPTLLLTNIIGKIEVFRKRYVSLQKGKHRITQKQLENEDSFRKLLDQLFDISSGKKGLTITDEQQQFLEDQRGERQLKIGSIKDKIQRPRKPNSSTIQRKIRYKNSDKRLQIEEFDVLSEDEQSDEKDEDFIDSLNCYQRTKINPRPEMLKKVLKSSDVLSTIDRINLSSGKFTVLASVMARACGEEINRSTISVSTVSRRRERNREIRSEQVKKKFKSTLDNVSGGLTIHFDGKKLKDLHATNSKDRIHKTERIGVVVTGNKIHKILGVPRANDGKGVTAAKTIFDACVDWNVVDRINGMCFDTTSANTGRLQGACKILEQEYFGRKLFHLACRHHVYEIVISGVFKDLFGETTGPTVELFKTFKLAWKDIDQKKFQVKLKKKSTSILQTYISRNSQTLPKKLFKKKFADINRKRAIDFFLHALSSATTYTPRGEYREIMELCLLILGYPLKDYTFKLPGACHNARWMAKVIYCFKIYIFRKQLELSESEISNLEQFCLFAALIYVKPWIECPLASDAPVNDLCFFKQIHSYSTLNKQISASAIEKFENHLWYLSSELVIFSLFSNKITASEKRQMVQKLSQQKSNWDTRATRLTNTINLQNKTLSDLIGVQSTPALRNLNVNIEFVFLLEPEEWAASDDYKKAKSVVDDMKVVNDVAERSMALIIDFNGTLTRKEPQKQLALQVVEENRNQIKGWKKETLASYQSNQN